MTRLAPILLAVLAACSTPAAADEVTVEVVLRYSRFVPASFAFERGTTVTFVVRNDDPITHEFLIGDEESQRMHAEGTHPHHGEIPGEITVPAGATRVTTYTFDEPGTLLIGCHLPRHYEYGMRGVIEVL